MQAKRKDFLVLQTKNSKNQTNKQTKVFLNTTPLLFSQRNTLFYQKLFILFFYFHFILSKERKRIFENTIQYN